MHLNTAYYDRHITGMTVMNLANTLSSLSQLVKLVKQQSVCGRLHLIRGDLRIHVVTNPTRTICEGLEGLELQWC